MFGKTNKLFVLYALVLLALMAPTFAAVIKRSRYQPQFGGLDPVPEDAAIGEFNDNLPVRTQREPYDRRKGALNPGSTSPETYLDALPEELREEYERTRAAPQGIPQQP